MLDGEVLVLLKALRQRKISVALFMNHLSLILFVLKTKTSVNMTMTTIVFESEGSRQEVEVPASWREVTVKQFLALKDKNDPIQIFAAFASVSPHLVFMAKDTRNLRKSLDGALKWVSEDEPDWVEIDKGGIFIFQGNPYSVKSIESLSFGIVSLLEQRMAPVKIEGKDEEEDTFIEPDLNALTPFACALYLQPLIDGEYKEDRLGFFEDKVLEAPAIQMFPLASFFFSKFVKMLTYGQEDSRQFLPL